jgi:hypothetical protein
MILTSYEIEECLAHGYKWYAYGAATGCGIEWVRVLVSPRDQVDIDQDSDFEPYEEGQYDEELRISWGSPHFSPPPR